MSTLPEIDLDWRKVVDKTTCIFGESGTGKSMVIKDLLSISNGHIDQVIVVSPTDKQNHTYDSGIVPLPMIHYTVSVDLLEQIWQRQEAFSDIYSRANDPVIIRKLFNMINDTKAAELLGLMEKRKRDSMAAICETHDEDTAAIKNNKLELDFSDLVAKVYKTHILANRDKLMRNKLTEQEKFTIKFINFNPKLLLIFDDCTDVIKKMSTTPVIQKIFYQGRHNNITCIIALHTDKALEPELKKNSFITVFTAEISATSYFERKSNDLDSDAKRRAKQCLRLAFTPVLKHQKLVWVRDERKFYRYTAKKHDMFRFGTQAFWDYCNKIKSDSSQVNTSNKFLMDLM